MDLLSAVSRFVIQAHGELVSGHYDPDLDLVAETSDGRLVGFCVGWPSAARRAAQIEPLGVDHAYQGNGIGRALLLAMLSRFRAHGAEYAQVETDNGRLAARAAYEAAGFRPHYRSLRKGQWCGTHHAT